MAYDVEEAKKLVVEAGKSFLKQVLSPVLGVMFLQESAILSLLSHRQAERMIRLHLMRLLLLILMTVHTRVILNRQVKEFTLMHISIIRLLISLFILTKRLRLLSALQVWKLKMYIMNSSLFQVTMSLLPNMLCLQQILFVRKLKNV